MVRSASLSVRFTRLTVLGRVCRGLMIAASILGTARPSNMGRIIPDSIVPPSVGVGLTESLRAVTVAAVPSTGVVDTSVFLEAAPVNTSELNRCRADSGGDPSGDCRSVGSDSDIPSLRCCAACAGALVWRFLGDVTGLS